MVTAVLLVGAIIGLQAGFSVPSEMEEETTHVAYDLKGSFTQTALGPAPPERQDPARYYRKIIDRVDVFYRYRFLPDEPLRDIREELTITGLVDCADGWEKRIGLAQTSGSGEALAVRFRLDTAAIDRMVQTITEEVGGSSCSPLVTIEAAVHTLAETDAGPLEEDFVQTAEVKLSSTSLAWDRDLEMSRIGYGRGIEYRQEGAFDYAIPLKPNSLYGEVMMQSEHPPARPLEPVKSDPPYDADTVERIDVSFDFRFQSDPVVTDTVHEVLVTASVGESEGRNEGFVLVPEHTEVGNFSSEFSLNMPLYYAMLKAIERESGPLETPARLLVTALVRTTAESEHGPIEEVFTQDLVLDLGPEQIVWPETVEAESSGTLTETATVRNPDAGTAKAGALGAMGIALVAFGFTAWNYRESRRRRLTAVEADTLEIRRKRREDLVVHVGRLPDIANWETMVELGSLAELLKASDGLLKPIMHCPEPEQDTYCIIDGPVRYVYISRAEKRVPDAVTAATSPVSAQPVRSDLT